METPAKPNGVHIGLELKRDGSKDYVWKIKLPGYMPLHEGCAGAVGNMRKTAAARRDLMIAYQKDCAKAKDIEGAKFFKEESADALKEYRAACLMLPLFDANPPGDCQYKPVWEWPVELAPWVDRVVHRVLF